MQDAEKPLFELQELRPVALWAAECAARALPLFTAAAPQDKRAQEAIEAARAFAATGHRTAKLRQSSWAAHAASREAHNPAARYAARAASAAAAVAFTHPITSHHQLNHLLAGAVRAALPEERANANLGATVGQAAITWAATCAPQEAISLVRRLPPREPGRGRVGDVFFLLDQAIREGQS